MFWKVTVGWCDVGKSSIFSKGNFLTQACAMVSSIFERRGVLLWWFEEFCTANLNILMKCSKRLFWV